MVIKENDKNLVEKSERYWNEIFSGFLDFDQKNRMKRIMESFTLIEILEFYRFFFKELAGKISLYYMGESEKSGGILKKNETFVGLETNIYEEDGDLEETDDEEEEEVKTVKDTTAIIKIKNNIAAKNKKLEATKERLKTKLSCTRRQEAVKQLLGTKKPDYKTAETMLDSGTSKRITKGPADYAAYGGKNFRTKK